LSLLMLLIMHTSLFAQPQVPVTWGQARWLNSGCSLESYHSFIMMGDTLLAGGTLSDGSQNPNYTPVVAHSFDNGQTWSAWQRLDSNFYDNVRLILSGADGRIFAFYDTEDSTFHVTSQTMRSLDGGATWATCLPPISNRWLSAGTAVGRQVVVVNIDTQGHFDKRISISDDGGDHWRLLIPLAGDSTFVIGAGLTRTNILLDEARHVGRSSRVGVSVGDRSSQSWSPYQDLPGQPMAAYIINSLLTADSSSETAIQLSVCTHTDGFVMETLYYQRTTDAGVSWSLPRTLSQGATLSSYMAEPEAFCHGKLWGVAWQDYGSADSTRWGIYFRLSANHGKDWYPQQYVDGVAFYSWYGTGQFVGNEVRLYWQGFHDSWTTEDYRTVNGTLTPDTLPPALTLDLWGQDTIRQGDTLRLEATAADNDTLSEVRVLISDSGQVSTVSMERTSGSRYSTTFVVPHEGRFDYRGQAEDFWENITSVPDTGWLSFVAQGPSATSSFILPPSSFAVSVFPNPSNGWPSLQLAPEWFAQGPVTVSVYNLLGQRLLQRRLANSRTSLAPDAPSASGLFVLEVASGSRTARQKLLILK
jgi:hypothetical protein